MTIRKTICRWLCREVPPEPLPRAPEPPVPATSPARLLANSLTDPETRSEWEKEEKWGAGYRSTVYRNKQRDLAITFVSGGPLYSDVLTPFSLNRAEKAIVTDALAVFNKRFRELKEADALQRLLGPAA